MPTDNYIEDALHIKKFEEALGSSPANVERKKIEVLFLDIDGILTPSRGRPADIRALAELVMLSKDPDSPKLAIFTGRQLPYLEAFCHILGIEVPSVCENGGIIFDPRSKEVIYNPKIKKEDLDILSKLKKIISDKVLPKYPGAKIELGKEVTISINPPEHEDIKTFFHKFVNDRDIKDIIGNKFSLTYSASAIDISPPDINKLDGVDYVLNELLHIDIKRVGAVGDAKNDLIVLEKVGFSATTSNGSDEVKRAVTYISNEPDARGTIDILKKCIELNKKVFKRVTSQ